MPKVIDFGIAKATSDQRLTDKTLFTAFEQFMGTPAYMSPEQAEMSPDRSEATQETMFVPQSWVVALRSVLSSFSFGAA